MATSFRPFRGVLNDLRLVSANCPRHPVPTGGQNRKGASVPVQVNLPTVLRPHAGGERSVAFEGTTVGEVLVALVARYPGMNGQVIDDSGALHKFVNVYINDDDVRYLSGVDTPVGSADELSILPAVAGGALAEVGHHFR
jgi:molybdopterin synthase sulfur carrier subunit